jgi:transposase InsO family protein
LRIFYDAISALQQDSKVNIATTETRKALDALVDYACNGLPQMVLARFPDVHATIIVVDASPRSWAATLFLLATVPEATAAQLPDTTAVVEQLRQSEQFRHRQLPPNVGLIPSFILADTFHEQGPSSTWYERRAQIDAVHALYPLCEGPIYVVSDNANSGKKWHNVDEAFSGTAYARLQFFQSNVSGIIWQQRDNLPSISDALARVVEAYARPRSRGTESPTTPSLVTLAASEDVEGHPSALKPRRERKHKRNRRRVRVATPTETFRETAAAAAAAATSEQLPAALETFLALVKPQYTDDPTLFLPRLPMSMVYSILTSTTPPSTKRENLVHSRFRLSPDGFVFLKSPAVGDRLYVPPFLTVAFGEGGRHSRGYLINHFHCASGPHLGITRTEADLCRYFFWPRMRHDVARFVGACTTCHTLKATHRPATGTLSSVVAQANHPFDILLMDFAAIPRTNESFLLIMDAFTHYTFAFRTKDQTAATVKNVLTNLFTQLSAPNRIHCDRGAHFNADIIHELSRSVGFELTFSPTGNPRSQGAAENAVKSVKAMLCTTLKSRRTGDSLDLCLRTAVQVHNATAIVRLGLCPAEILLGFRPKLPGMWPPESPAQDGPLSIPELDTIRHALRTVWRIRRDEYIARYQDQYFLAARESKIGPGDYVQYQPPLMAPGKTYPNPRGFFRVIKPAGSNTWYLSRTQWRPEAPLDTLADLEVGDIAPETHLVRFELAPDLRLGLDSPPPPPSLNTRPATRATNRSSH